MIRKSHKKKKNVSRKRSRKNIKLFYITLVVLLAGALVFTVGIGGIGSNPAPDVIPTGSLTAANDFHNFGRLSMKDGKVSRLFRLKNTSSEPALIRKLYTS